MNNLQEFFKKFFNNLNSEIKIEEDRLIISKVPEKFEKFSGKKSPYFFTFQKEKTNYEFITPNHFLVKAIKEFLDGTGETVLLKLETPINFIKEIPKILPLKNSKIKNISKQVTNKIFFKFTFSTIFQYLNQRENETNEIFVKEEKIINPQENFKLQQGNKREIKEIILKKEYELAKLELRKKITPKIQELSKNLKEKLTHELERTKLHYKNNLKEFEEKEKNLKKQIENNPQETNKIDKAKKTLENLYTEQNLEKIKEEEKFFLEHEIKKHSLTIKNKLLNTAIIYYPQYKLNLILDLGNKNNKLIELEYDSLSEKISPIYCQTCKKELKEIIICSSGHLTCRNCGTRCNNCNLITCNSCSLKKCSNCKKTLCSGCISSCDECKKIYCLNHLNKISQKNICSNCMKRCSKCNSIIDKNTAFKKEGKIICINCSTKKAKKEIMKEIFDN